MDAVRCRRSVYCIGQTYEEFPVCPASLGEQGTFSEVRAMKPAALLCIYTLDTLLVIPGKTRSKFYHVWQRTETGSREKNTPPKTKKVNASVCEPLSACWILFFLDMNYMLYLQQ